MKDIEAAFAGMKWIYALNEEPATLHELEKRIIKVARCSDFITYSDLVDGVVFHAKNVKKSPFKIDVHEWEPIDQAIIGDYLGYLSWQSYRKHKLFISALVVSKQDDTPGEGFYNLMKELGLLSPDTSEERLSIWSKSVSEAHTYYTKER